VKDNTVAVEFSRFETEKQAGDALYNELRRYLGEGADYHAPEDSGEISDRTAAVPYVVMLAGGSTPLAVYRRIADHVPSRVHPAIHLMLSDDRYVPADDDRSNFGHVRPLARALRLPEERLLHVDATRPLPEAVAGYGADIVALRRRDAIFALGILGIGADGHTASLFTPDMVALDGGLNGSGVPGVSAMSAMSAAATGAAASEASLDGRVPGDRPTPAGGDAPGDRPAPGTLTVENPADAAIHTGTHGGVDRVSVSAPVILSFRRLIFFATGESKRDILYELSRRPEDYPAGRILLQHPNATIWTDEAPRVR
jgi:6-phosphogluconolactonase/glucosamine-6-phosphate isomerase/deaminase